MTSKNDNVDGDAAVVNNDNTLSNSLITPVASRASIQDLTTASTTPEASASLLPSSSSSPNNSMLLREWSVTPNLTQLQPLPNVSTPIPPVAPAVLLIQREGSSNSTATVDATATRTSPSFQYPVATFVTNLVRSVSENVREEIRGYIPPGNAQRPQINIEALTSPRNILGTTATITTKEIGCIVNKRKNNNDFIPIIASNNGQNNINAPLVADFEDDSQDWTMLNGELVRRLDYMQEEDAEANEFNSRSLGNLACDDIDVMQKGNLHTSKSSRIQRGVKGLKKLKKIFSGGNNIGASQKKKVDRIKFIEGESTRRKQGDSQEQVRRRLEMSNQSTLFELRNYEPNEFNDSGRGGELSILDVSDGHLRRDTASDDDNGSGDGGSFIDASYSQQLFSLSHQTTLTATSSHNNSYDGDNSTISTNKVFSEEREDL